MINSYKYLELESTYWKHSVLHLEPTCIDEQVRTEDRNFGAFAFSGISNYHFLVAHFEKVYLCEWVNFPNNHSLSNGTHKHSKDFKKSKSKYVSFST